MSPNAWERRTSRALQRASERRGEDTGITTVTSFTGDTGLGSWGHEPSTLGS